MPRPPLPLASAAAVEAVEGAAAVVLGLFVGIQTVTGNPHDVPSSAGVAVLAVLGGAGMLAVGAALARQRRWARAPAALTQILALPVGVSMLQAGRFAIGMALLVAGVGGLVSLFMPASGRALLGDPPPGTSDG